MTNDRLRSEMNSSKIVTPAVRALVLPVVLETIRTGRATFNKYDREVKLEQYGRKMLTAKQVQWLLRDTGAHFAETKIVGYIDTLDDAQTSWTLTVNRNGSGSLSVDRLVRTLADFED